MFAICSNGWRIDMMNFKIAIAPILPIPVLLGFVLASVLVLALGFYVGRRGTLVRALGLALILLALVDPSLVREDREPLKDVVAVVLDRSASQAIGERKEQTDKARALIEKELADLGTVEARFIEAGQEDAAHDGTKLFTALNEALADVPPERIGGAIMVTDGIVHDIPAQVEALGFRAPLHALITGHEGERDRRIELVEAPRFGLVGKDQTISIRVLDTGGSNELVNVLVRRDGVELGTVRARTGVVTRVPVRIDHGGPNVVELEVPTMPDELTALNNKSVLTIDGVRDKLKVLLVSGEPHAGERTWRNLLKADANVDLIHFTILRPPEKQGQDGAQLNELSLIAFPTADLFGRKINEFDLIIFDRYSNQTILPSIYFENIVRYVRYGGALLMAVGPDFSAPEGLFYSPLGRIAPAKPNGRVIERAFQPSVTVTGNKHPVTRDLPGQSGNTSNWSQWFRQVMAEPSTGIPVMAGADNLPLLVLSREAKGRVALLLSDQIWLWARNYDQGGPYLDLLRRLAHWLMKEPELEEEALRASARGRDISIERQTLKSDTPPIQVFSPSGKTQDVVMAPFEPGLTRGKVTVDEFGLYKVSDGLVSTLVSVGPENPREFQEVVSTPDKLRPLIEASGGTIRRISGAAADLRLPRFVSMRESPVYGGTDYVGFRRTGSSIVTGIGVAPMAIGFFGLIVLLGGVLLGWLWEGRKPRIAA
jgi:hypothetical protein